MLGRTQRRVSVNTLSLAARRRGISLVVLVLALFTAMGLLAGCGPRQLVSAKASSTSTPAAAKQVSVATATPVPAAPTASPRAVASASSGQTSPTAAATPSVIARAPASTLVSQTPDSSTVQAIKSVILKANNEQAQAFTKNDPSLMQDTAVPSYYAKISNVNVQLAQGGVTAIKLINLRWGPVTVTGPTSADATTFETWQTTFANGATLRSTDRNVYTLSLTGGSWKIATDAHPSSQLDQPPSGVSPSVPGQPGVSPNVPGQPTVIPPVGTGQSRNWSGYAATGGTYTGVSGTWTVPQASSQQRLASGATWVGIGGVRTRDLIQAGTEQTAVGPNTVRYQAWIETLPQPSHQVPLVVNPGDSVTVSIAQQKAGEWLVTLKNNTTGKSYNQTVQYNSSLSSAEWIEEAPSGGRQVLPLVNFGSVNFTNASAVVNGKTETIAQAGGRPVSMIGPYGQVVAAPSSLSSNGRGFSISQVTTPTVPTLPVPRFRRVPFYESALASA